MIFENLIRDMSELFTVWFLVLFPIFFVNPLVNHLTNSLVLRNVDNIVSDKKLLLIFYRFIKKTNKNRKINKYFK